MTLQLPADTLRNLRSKGLKVQLLPEKDVDRAHEIEAEAYPSDEAASRENFAIRRRDAGSFFTAAYLQPQGLLVGYVCGTLTSGDTLSHDTMYSHDPRGTCLCVHSVAVHKDHRRQGYASAILKAYVEHVALGQPGVRKICLISKAHLLGFYASCGFQIVGLSGVSHGQDPWFEMSVALDSRPPRALPFLQVDAFADQPFKGNPAAVFFTHRGGDAVWMGKLAQEMNLSETAFVEACDEDPDASEHDANSSEAPACYRLRWFTPAAEVDLCGHATLASAHALWETGRVAPGQPIRFQTLSGALTCTRDGGDTRVPPKQGAGGAWISLDFPAEPPKEVGDRDLRTVLCRGLCLRCEDVLYVGRNRMDILVEVSQEAFRERLRPNRSALMEVETRGVIVTCQAEGAGHDFESRFFAPRLGIDEDPVTGSAHCCLGPYWAAKLGRVSLVGVQASARSGLVRVCYCESAQRVKIAGAAVTVFEGLLRCTQPLGSDC